MMHKFSQSELSKVPQFELVGPKCKKDGCHGIVVKHMNIENKKLFLRYSKCKDEKPGW